ncbi:MAG: prevent-host-death protein, partial [Bacteroidia bacterium]
MNKQQPLNTMSTVSARMLSVDEANRYAGGFDDPARLASAFAGVASNSGVNGIIVRGNAPKYLQWKMEGIEIPNPNHFGDLRAFGGGILTGLSSQMLANSDFFTGAFPAEYNNAVSGVFDIAMRTGNNQKRESTFQAGIIGLDVAQEGPFRKGGQASYLFNYRYSTLALLTPLLPENANTIKYQDLSFKLNFPTKKAGTFSLWGIGLLDGAGAKPKTDSTQWFYADSKQRDDLKLYIGGAGLTHKYFFNSSVYLKTTLAGSGNSSEWISQSLNTAMELKPNSTIRYENVNYVLSSILNNKISARHNNRSGILATYMNYSILLNKAFTVGQTPVELVNASGNT